MTIHDDDTQRPAGAPVVVVVLAGVMIIIAVALLVGWYLP